MVGQRSGAMTSMEVVTGDIEFFTLYTTIDITNTDDFGDSSQKDFESVVQIIGMRAVELDGTGNNLLENYGAPSMTGAGYIFKFATERPGAHTVETRVNEFDNIVLNGGTVDTKNSKNMEFTKQDLL